MAADETKQPSKQRVVEMVKASRNRKGAYQADYNCPACRAPLVSLDDTLLGTETCPKTFQFMGLPCAVPRNAPAAGRLPGGAPGAAMIGRPPVTPAGSSRRSIHRVDARRG